MSGVADLYRQILGRDPDPGGLAYWEQQFGGSVSPEERQAFINSANAELANRPAEERAQLSPATGGGLVSDSNVTTSSVTPQQQFTTVADLYRQILGRDPDPEGLAYWNQQFGSDVSPEERQAFINSANAELANPTAVTTSSATSQQPKTVADLYRTLLGRDPDPGGLDYWTKQFGPDISPEEVETFKTSAREAHSKMTPEQRQINAPKPGFDIGNTQNNTPASEFASIEDLYRKLLGRDPDTGGQEYWTKQFMDPSSPGGAAITPEEVEIFKTSVGQVQSKLPPDQQKINAPKLGFDLGPYLPRGTDVGYRGEALDPTKSTLSPNFADYVYRMLAKGEAAADLPYQPYTGDRFADVTDTLKNAFEDAENLGTPEAFAEAERLLTAVGKSAGELKYDPTKFDTGLGPVKSVEDYMSPYIGNVTDILAREARREADIARQAEQARLARAGAYGGSRQAIMEAERQRNLGTQIEDIRTKGLNAAYDRAMEQRLKEAGLGLEAQKGTEDSKQFGAEYGLKGLDLQRSAGTALGTVGALEGSYGIDAIKTKLAAGQTEQDIVQKPFDFAYQQWLESQKYPFQTATYMHSLLGGLPLSSRPYDDGTSALGGALQGLALGAAVTGGIK